MRALESCSEEPGFLVPEGSPELAQTSSGPMSVVLLPVCERLCVLGFCLMFPEKENSNKSGWQSSVPLPQSSHTLHCACWVRTFVYFLRFIIPYWGQEVSGTLKVWITCVLWSSKPYAFILYLLQESRTEQPPHANRTCPDCTVTAARQMEAKSTNVR